MADRPRECPQLGTLMEPRSVTEDDLAFWTHRNGVAAKIEMKGEHIGARKIEVVRSEAPGWGLTWNVPYVDPEGDGSTYWFTMFSDAFPPVAAVAQNQTTLFGNGPNPYYDQPIPMRLPCPSCGALHVDEGEFVTKVHHTHACQECGEVWRPAVVATVGVRFLPGFKNEGTDRG